jgi:hypothetical protein
MTTPPRRALWAGPGVRRALAAGGPGIVESALPPGGYVRFGDEWLLLSAALAAGLGRRGATSGAAMLWGFAAA